MADLQAKVDKWLAEQGYPLEFRAAQAFSTNGLVALQGTYIQDPVSTQLREVDVVAVHETGDREVICRTSIVVECKWSREKPWVVFTSPQARASRERAVTQIVASAFGHGVLWHFANDGTLQRYVEEQQPARIGFGGRQAFCDSDGKDQFYAAIQKVTAASLALAGPEDLPRVLDATAKMLAHIVYPVILISAPLFEAYFDGTNVKTEQIAQSRVAWHGHEGHQEPVPVDIVTLDALEEYARRMAIHCRELAVYIQNPARNLRRAIFSHDASGINRQLTAMPPVPRVLQGLLEERGTA